VELMSDSGALSALLLDLFELPRRGTRVTLEDSGGAVVPLDALRHVQQQGDNVTFKLRVLSPLPPRAAAGQGVVQLLGDENQTRMREDEPNAIIQSLLLPSIFSSGGEATREGYVPIDSEDWRPTAATPRDEKIADPRVEGGAEEFRGRAYQNQLTKFNRILAHLVNDRTVLAWFRCNLAFVSLSLKYMKLASSYSHAAYVSFVLLGSGGVFMVLLPISWWSGYRRYSKCKELLDYDITRISSYLHKMGFDLDTSVFFFIVLLSFITICYSATAIIWSSGASETDDAVANDIVPG